MRDFLSDIETGEAKSPEASAQEHMRPKLPKRFYKTVSVAEENEQFRVLLDGRPVKTPLKNTLALPSEVAAKLAADEWEAQETDIDPAKMPVTRLVNTALDGIATDPQAVLEDIVRFASNDLLCYRAGHPDQLVVMQAEHWDPILDWAVDEIGARFEITEGIIHIAQPKEASITFSARLKNHSDPIKLACLHTMTSLSGSAIIALALAEDFLDLEEGWKAAHVDEDFGISRWGEDHDAKVRREARFVEMQAAYQLLKTL